MRWAVLTWGTRGDVQPLLTLAGGLRARGDTVRFGALSAHADLVRRHGFAFHALGSPMAAAAYREMMDTMHAEPNPRRQNRALLQEVLLGDLDRLFADCREAAADCDAVIAHWLQVGGGLAAESLGLPWASVTLNAAGIGCEQAMASREELRARQGYSRWLWGDRLSEFRAAHGLRPVDVVADSVYSPRLNLVAMSPRLLPESAHWPQQHRVVGFLHGPTHDPDWVPEPALAAFLRQYPQPVVVTLGSSAGDHIDAKLRVVLQALDAMGLPVIVQALLADAPPPSVPASERMLLVGEVPHGWLFPQTCCVIHHGGAGGSAAALRAGVPSLAMGNLFDQPYWGQLLAEQGLAARPIVETEIAVDTVIERVREALALAPQCQAFAADPDHGNGVRNAVEWLHREYAFAACAAADQSDCMPTSELQPVIA